jgi:hypothetical protein
LRAFLTRKDVLSTLVIVGVVVGGLVWLNTKSEQVIKCQVEMTSPGGTVLKGQMYYAVEIERQSIKGRNESHELHIEPDKLWWDYKEFGSDRIEAHQGSINRFDGTLRARRVMVGGDGKGTGELITGKCYPMPGVIGKGP